MNGWVRPRAVGNYRTDYLMRSVANYTGIWANNSKEVVYFAGTGLDGSQTYTQTYLKDELPRSKTHYFWSVIAVDTGDYKVIPNSLNRFLLNKQSPIEVRRRRLAHAGLWAETACEESRNQTGSPPRTARSTT